MNKLRLELDVTDAPTAPCGKSYGCLLYADEELLSKRYAVDYSALARSARYGGNFFIFTCGCGDHGCAGIDAPIKVVHQGDTLSWHITEPLPERHLTFSRAAYRAEALRFLQEAHDRVEVPEDLDNYPFGHYGFTPAHLNDCLELLRLSRIRIMADYGDAYAWDQDGVCVGLHYYFPEIADVKRIEEELETWAGDFWSSRDEDPNFPWEEFHSRGLDLATRLNATLPSEMDVEICYERPWEDPQGKNSDRTILRPLK